MRTNAAAEIGRLPGFTVNPHAPDRPFFKEFVARLPVPVADANRWLRDEIDVIGGYDLGRDHEGFGHAMLIAVTEMTRRDEIDRLVTGLRAVAETMSGPGDRT